MCKYANMSQIPFFVAVRHVEKKLWKKNSCYTRRCGFKGGKLMENARKQYVDKSVEIKEFAVRVDVSVKIGS